MCQLQGIIGTDSDVDLS